MIKLLTFLIPRETGKLLSWWRLAIGTVALVLIFWKPFLFNGPRPKEVHFNFFDWWVGPGFDVAYLFLPQCFLIALALGCYLELISRVAISPFSSLFEDVFYPRDSEVPPPDYPLARIYGQQRRWADALRVYRGIVRNHPQEKEAYTEGIRMAFRAGEPGAAARLRLLSRRVKCKVWRSDMEQLYRRELSQFRR